jgi:hypothetical protein
LLCPLLPQPEKPPDAKHKRAQRRFRLVDGDPGNNDPSNVASLCRRCHMTVDGRLDRLVMYRRSRIAVSA